MKILFVPHTPTRELINRVYEFSKMTDSYFLSWYIDNSSFRNKVFSQLKTIFQKNKLENNILTIPLLFRPEGLAVVFNTFMLNYVIKKYNIDLIVNANAWMFNVKDISVPVVYDLVDDHLTINHEVGVSAKRLYKIQEDLRASRGIICVTETLQKKANRFNYNTLTVENGVYIERFSESYSLKETLGLSGKKVYGYIGGVNAWTGIDKACDAYIRIKNKTNAMIVVGDDDSDFFKNLKIKYSNDILFIGQVSPERVGNYFKTLDIGLIPFDLNEYTRNAFPIKALEYGLAGAMVISTKLSVLEEKNFPFIEFCEIRDFPKLMKYIEKKEYTFKFDNYSWKKQSEKILNFINKIDES